MTPQIKTSELPKPASEVRRRPGFPAALWSIALLTCLATFACDDTAPTTAPVHMLRTVEMTIGKKSYTLEVADTDATREHGLMERDTLPSDHGMIFVFDDETPRNFWMYHTRFPLDILYVGSTGKIVSIKHMKPYDESNVPSDGPAKYAIELSVNETDKDGVHAGDTLSIPNLSTPAATSKP